jgi:hypothetical protein
MSGNRNQFFQPAKNTGHARNVTPSLSTNLSVALSLAGSIDTASAEGGTIFTDYRVAVVSILVLILIALAIVGTCVRICGRSDRSSQADADVNEDLEKANLIADRSNPAEPSSPPTPAMRK